MSQTLTYTDSITRIGHTKIDGNIVVEHRCVISKSNPASMSLSYTKINSELYKSNRETCRADIAEFEDAAYELQDEYLAALSETENDDDTAA